ncbi:MAG: ABC transporter permease [Gammaproteobacteria bacterium]|nr:ABC transporter permease [Gammaproteobacteria bacterium]
MMLFSLAYKNLWRNLRRTMLTEFSIVFGVLVIIGSGNFINGMQRDWAKFEINSNTGAFQVEHRDYQEMGKSEPLKVTLENSAALVERISKMPGVRAAYGKLNFSGMVSSGVKSTFFDGRAVDVARQRQTLSQQQDLIVAGKQLGDTSGGVILGADLADMLGIKIGDPVTIVVQTLHGGLNLTYATLVGTKNGRHFPSTIYLEMPLDDAQKLLRVHDRVSQVVVGAEDFDGIPALMQRVEAELRNEQVLFSLRGYQVLIPVYPRAIPSFKFISIVVGIVLFILVGGGIGNVMAMAVLERKKEIGTLRALGMEKNQVRRLFLTEGFIIGVIGALAGLLLASALTQFIATHGGIHLPPPPGTHQILVIIPQMDTFTSMLGVAMPILVSVLGAWWPAATSANLNPIEALTEA